MVALLHFTVYIRCYRTQNNGAKKGSDAKELEQLNHLSMKIQEATSSAAITEKN